MPIVPDPAGAAPDAAPLRVLIVGDGRTGRVTLARWLTRAGHDVEAVASEEAALDALAGGAFDVALVDLDAPGVGGVDVVQLHRVAELIVGERRLPIVGLTAAGAGPEHAACGLDACLVQPVDRARLLDTVRGVAGGRRPADSPPDEGAAAIGPGVAHARAGGLTRPAAGADAGGAGRIVRALADAASVFGRLAAAGARGVGLPHGHLAAPHGVGRASGPGAAGRDDRASLRGGAWDGRPPEPDESGWHWVEDAGGLRPLFWHGEDWPEPLDRGGWRDGPAVLCPRDLRHGRYRGPVVMPPRSTASFRPKPPARA